MISHTLEKATGAATYTSGAAAILFGYTANEIAAITAAAICILSYATTQGISAYFKLQHLRLEQRKVDDMLRLEEQRVKEMTRIEEDHNKAMYALEQEKIRAMREIAERNTIMTLPSLTCEDCPTLLRARNEGK